MSVGLNGFQSLSQMTLEVGYFLNDITTARRAKIAAAINRRYQMATTVQPWPQLTRSESSGLRTTADPDLKNLVAGEAEVPLPYGVGRLLSVSLLGEPGGTLEARSGQAFWDEVRDHATLAGTPCIYTLAGYTAQYRSLAAAGALIAKSNSSGNDAAKTVRVHFRKGASGTDQTAWQDLSGAFSSGVSLGSGAGVLAGYAVEKVVLPVGWVGNFTLEDSGAVKVTSIQPIEVPVTATNLSQIVYTRKLIRVWPVPDTSAGLAITWLSDALPMSEDEDTPQIPVSRALVAGAIADMLAQKGELAAASKYEGQFNEIMAGLTGFHQSDAQGRVIPRGRNSLTANGVWHY